MDRDLSMVRLLVRAQHIILDGPDATRTAQAAPSGAMIALVPTEQDAARLTVDGGEAAEQLHATLHYLGEGADYSQASRDHMVELVRGYFADVARVEAEAFAVNVFNPATEKRPTCLVLGLSGDALADAHGRAAGAVDDYGADTPEQHQPWHAHLALAYIDDLGRLPECVKRCGPITFDRVRVAFAGQHIDIPLAAEPDP